MFKKKKDNGPNTITPLVFPECKTCKASYKIKFKSAEGETQEITLEHAFDLFRQQKVNEKRLVELLYSGILMMGDNSIVSNSGKLYVFDRIYSIELLNYEIIEDKESSNEDL